MGKVQFTSDDETSAWFGKTAKEEGVSQPALFAQMRSAFETHQTIQGHPAHGASLETLEGLIGSARDLFKGLVVECDTADEQAAKRVEKRLGELERQLAEARAEGDKTKRALEKALDDTARLAREKDDALRQAEDLRRRADDLEGAHARERAALEEAREARTALEEARASASAAEKDVTKLTVELAVRDAELARADAEIRRLTQASGAGAEEKNG